MIKQILSIKLLLGLILSLVVTNSFAQKAFPTELPKSEELGIYEHLDETLSGDLEFTDENGKKVLLKDLIILLYEVKNSKN